MKPPSSNIPTPLMLCLGRPGRLVISMCISLRWVRQEVEKSLKENLKTKMFWN